MNPLQEHHKKYANVLKVHWQESHRISPSVSELVAPTYIIFHPYLSLFWWGRNQDSKMWNRTHTGSSRVPRSSSKTKQAVKLVKPNLWCSRSLATNSWNQFDRLICRMQVLQVGFQVTSWCFVFSKFWTPVSIFVYETYDPEMMSMDLELSPCFVSASFDDYLTDDPHKCQRCQREYLICERKKGNKMIRSWYDFMFDGCGEFYCKR
jgi:hypothetical protein